MACCRYSRLGDLKDFEQAMNLCGKAMEGIPREAPEVTWSGPDVFQRYSQSRTLEDLYQAIKSAGEAATTAPLGASSKQQFLHT